MGQVDIYKYLSLNYSMARTNRRFLRRVIRRRARIIIQRLYTLSRIIERADLRLQRAVVITAVKRAKAMKKRAEYELSYPEFLRAVAAIKRVPNSDRWLRGVGRRW